MLDYRLYNQHYKNRPYWKAIQARLRTSEPLPSWLEKAAKDPSGYINEKDYISKTTLRDSCFCGAIGNDAFPIKYWSGLFFSYLYVDSLYNDNQLENYIRPHNLKGYECLAMEKKLFLSSKKMNSLWHEIALKVKGIKVLIGGREPQYATEEELIELLKRESPKEWNHKGTPQNAWAWVCLYRRHQNLGNEHGPEFLAVTFIACGAALAYYYLYVKNQVRPKGLTLNNPGMFDWLALNHTSGICYHILKMNNAGLPLYYLYHPYFPEWNTPFYERRGGITPSLWALSGREEDKDNDDRPRILRPGQHPS